MARQKKRGFRDVFKKRFGTVTRISMKSLLGAIGITAGTARPTAPEPDLNVPAQPSVFDRPDLHFT